MNKMQHPSNNGVLGAPPDTSIDECGALPVTHMECEGIPVVVSYWKPDADELARLAAGKPVALLVWGKTHAPVAVMVDQ